MSAFDINHLDKRFAFIDDLPEPLFELVLQQTRGELEERTQAITNFRSSLLAGVLPNSDQFTWPAPDISEAFIDFLTRHEIPRFSRDQPELVDELLKDFLQALTTSERQLPTSIEDHFRELKRLANERAQAQEEQREQQEEQGDPSEEADKEASPPPPELTEAELEELLRQAREQAHLDARRQVIATLDDGWSERVAAWREILDVFGTLAGFLGRGLDYARGLLRSQGWTDIARLRELMETLPELRDLIETLGQVQLSV